MAGYSLTVVRPTRIGRMAAPSSDELVTALRHEQALTQGMTQPGANQMIGYRFAAQQNALDAKDAYDLAVQQHSDTLRDMREEDRRRAVEDRDFNARRAIITSGINNPAGLSAITAPEVEGLMDPERRAMYGDLLRAQVDARDRQYTLRPGNGSGGSRATGEVRPVDQFRADETHNRALEGRIQQELNALRTEEDRIRRNVFNRQEQQRQIDAARERSRERIAALEGQRRRAGSAPQPQQPREGAGGGEQRQQQSPTAQQPPRAAQPPQGGDLPPQARAQLREGQVTTFRNGQKWTLRNGQPQRVE